MSQTGFPNGGILPDDTETHKYSNLIRTEEQIKEISNTIKAQAYANNVFDPVIQTTIANQAEGIVTAVLGLAQYYHQQVSYQGVDGYGSENNPVNPVYSDSTNQIFAQSLGSNSDPESLFQNYENSATGSRELLGVQNFFFNLGAGSKSFTWDANGNLSISDVYKFTGLNDFGIAPPKDLTASAAAGDIGAQIQTIPYLLGGMVGVVLGGVLFGPTAIINGTVDSVLGLISNVFFNGLKPGDKIEGFDWSVLRDENGNPYTNYQLGGLDPMNVRHTWTPQQLYDWNPELFWDAVAKGLIPFSALLLMPDFICNSISVGAGPDPFGFLPNYAPVNTVMSTDPSNWTFGGGGNYPRPFTSFAQRITEANLSLGPFAMIDFKNPTTNVSLRFSGRICNLAVVCNGAPGEVGFIRQDWYGADLSGTGYGSNLLKWQWWEQAIKTKYTFPYGHLPGYPEVTIEVATASYAVGNANNFAPDIPTPEDYTLLLGTVLAAAALGAIL
jgi:hypothetical protein